MVCLELTEVLVLLIILKEQQKGVTKMLKHSEIAHIAHEANKVYCESIGDDSQVGWDDAEDWQRESAINGVDNIANGEITTPQQSHENWLKEKQEDGWVWAAEKNPEAKEHPCFMPFDELPAQQQFKDHLFFTIVMRLLQVSAKFAHA